MIRCWWGPLLRDTRTGNHDGSSPIRERDTLCICVTLLIPNCVCASRFNKSVCVFAMAVCLNSSALVAHVRLERRFAVFTDTQRGRDGFIRASCTCVRTQEMLSKGSRGPRERSLSFPGMKTAI